MTDDGGAPQHHRDRLADWPPTNDKFPPHYALIGMTVTAALIMAVLAIAIALAALGWI